MAKKRLSKEDAFKVLWNNGFFHGWQKIVKEYEPSVAEGAAYKAYLFEKLLAKVQEAKRELQHLEQCVQRLEIACKRGTIKNPATALQAFDDSAAAVRGGMQAFDGWVTSLLETDLTLLHYLFNPETSGNKLKNLQTSFAQLATLRAKEQQLWARDPDPFAFGITYHIP